MRIERRSTDYFNTFDAVSHIVDRRQFSASEMELQIFHSSLVKVTRLKVLHTEACWKMLLRKASSEFFGSHSQV